MDVVNLNVNGVHLFIKIFNLCKQLFHVKHLEIR